MIKKINEKSIQSIILITPPPVSEPHRIKHVFETYKVTLKEAERTNQQAGIYANACKQLGQELSIPVIDVWTEFQDQSIDWAERYLIDGLHFTKEGDRLLGELVLQQIKESYPDLVSDAFAFDVPEWTAFAANKESASELIESHLKRRGY